VQVLTVACVDDSLGHVDSGDRGVDEPRPHDAGGFGEWGPALMTQCERLCDRQRAIDEVGGGRDKGQIDAIGGKCVQGQEALDAGDAAAGDDDTVCGAGHEFTIGVVGQVR
jgi:hypothetical protein